MPRNGRELQHRQLRQICKKNLAFLQMVQRCEEFFETSFSILDPRPNHSKTMRNPSQLDLFFCIAWKLTVTRNRKGEQWRSSNICKKQHVSRLSLKLPAWSQKIHQQPGPPDLTSTCHLRHKKSGNLSPSKKTTCWKNSHKDILAAI